MSVIQLKLHKNNNLAKRIVFFALLALLLINLSLFQEKEVKAASSTIYFESASKEVTVGDEITVTLCIDSDVTLGDFEGYVSYNSEVLEYKNNNSSITGGEGTLKVYDFGTSSKYTRKYIMSFKVIGIGNCEFSISDSPVAYEFESGDAMSVSSTAYAIQAQATKTASENANLAALSISPGSLTPAFSVDVFEYNTIVDEDTKDLIVSAIPEDLNAKVTMSGNQDLAAGNNTVTIIVTSESGKSIEYKITVFKEITEDSVAGGTEKETDGEPQETVENTEDNTEEDFNAEWRFEALKKDGEIYITGQYYYTVVDSSDQVIIPNGYEPTSFVLDGFNITAYQQENNPANDYLLLILKNEAGDDNLYRYDRVEKTIQRYPEEQIIINSASAESTEMAKLTAVVEDYEGKLNQLGLIIAFLCAVIGILMIVLIKYILKTRGIQEDDFD